jgi:hypothetical protein
MQVEAIYDSGKLTLPSIRLKHSRIRLQVIIPDDEIINESAVDRVEQGSVQNNGDANQPSIVSEIEKILGPWRNQFRNMPPLNKEEMRELRCDEWEEKHREKP